ncbi:hypothetical protein PVT68_14335 [Microbulbifer bruguierae]|uniref:Uncharacterized protein n=1 Tax=Microbulbifer bruguierae TaxID=3029061 RepID=A0ABY8NBH8_9GAMM|nr:hypothetical protein [Microbulbifer bruguierae]WGL15942.1 hypothetical protein PVT68_14335 [Microbulbifer bruguierae]
MRFGILLILLQSLLLCAEGRAESPSLQLDSAEKMVRLLLPDSSEPQPEPSDAAVFAQVQPIVINGEIAALPCALTVSPSSAVRAAHAIRGPPLRQ